MPNSGDIFKPMGADLSWPIRNFNYGGSLRWRDDCFYCGKTAELITKIWAGVVSRENSFKNVTKLMQNECSRLKAYKFAYPPS